MKGPFKDPIGVKEKSIKPVQAFGDQPNYESKKRMFPGGDYYGTGFKAKVGHLRGESLGNTNIPQKASRSDPTKIVPLGGMQVPKKLA